jgi:hypothetical protein
MHEKFKFLLQDKVNRMLLVGLIIFAGVLAASSGNLGSASPAPSADTAADPYSADTFIPNGFVLVPIDIQNIDSLSSMIGQFGLVDLFTTSNLNQKSGLRVGRRLKLLRAPLNPQQFAVLVPEEEAGELLKAIGPFVAVIQNPADKRKTELTTRVAPLTSGPQIEYFKGARK